MWSSSAGCRTAAGIDAPGRDIYLTRLPIVPLAAGAFVGYGQAVGAGEVGGTVGGIGYLVTVGSGAA